MTIILIILFDIAGDHISLTYLYPVIVLLVNVIVSAMINYFNDKKLKAACSHINNKEVQKYEISKRHKGFESRTWAKLRSGDIIKIRENEEFPADVLILDVISQASDHKCFVRGGF